ncbi:MAG: ComEC family competence protein, partial [Deltaproteobacteria bacterium]|nr:ComEC family competence protein [Deltaproteobacteria bacterium]
MRPLLPFLISFISGILAASRFHFSYRAVYLSLAASVLAILFLSLRGIRFNSHAASIPFFFLGALSILPYARPEFAPGHIKDYVTAASFKDDGNEPSSGSLGMDVEGVVLEAIPGNGLTRLTVEARLIRGENGSHGTHGRVLLTLSWREDGIRRGDTVRFLSRLKVPSNFGNPGEYDYAGMLGFRGIYAVGFVKSVRLLAKVKGAEAVSLSPAARLSMAFDNARARVRLFIEGTGAIYAEPLKALIIGESRGIDHGTKAAFIATGTAHVLAISGLHVGMVAWFSYGLFIFLLKRSARLMLAYDIKRIAVILMLFPVILYGLLAGFPVSTERAVIMAAAFAVTLLLNRGKDLYNVLALSAFVILLTQPHALWDVSFQLTFAAVLAILYIAPKLIGLMPEKKDPFEEKGVRSWLRAALRRRIMPAIAVTIAASAGTYPIIAYHFHMASLTGLAANLIVVPLTGVAVPILLLSAVTLPISEVAAVLIRLSDAAFGVMAAVVKLFAALPWSSVQVTTPTPLEITLFYLLVISLVNAKKGRLYRYASAAIIMFMLLDWGWWGYQA